MVKHLWSFCFMVLPFCYHSPTNKSSVRESGKVKSAAEKASTAATAARADTKGRGTPDSHGKMFKVCLIQMYVPTLAKYLCPAHIGFFF